MSPLRSLLSRAKLPPRARTGGHRGVRTEGHREDLSELKKKIADLQEQLDASKYPDKEEFAVRAFLVCFMVYISGAHTHRHRHRRSG